MKTVNMIAAMSLLALSASTAFAGNTYDCNVTKYTVQDKAYGKGQNAVCGETTLTDQVGSNNAYFDDCDGLTLSINNLSPTAGYRIELAKLKPGKASDWMNRSPMQAATITVESGADAPKHFGLALNIEVIHAIETNDAVEYDAVCTQK